MSLTGLLPDPPEPDALYEAFVGWTERQGLTLYSHQDEAVIELFSGTKPPIGDVAVRAKQHSGTGLAE